MKMRALIIGLVSLLLTNCSKPPPDPKRPAKRTSSNTAPVARVDPQTGEVDVVPPDSGGIGPSQAPGAGATLLSGKKVTIEDITDALRAYVISRQISSSTITNLEVLVKHKFLPELPPPPPGKKYVWNKYSVVSLSDK
jgi:hypothetical protein